MNLDGIKGETYSLNGYAEKQVNQFKDVIHCLTNIECIVSRHDAALSKTIRTIIDRYYDMIRLIDNDYTYTIADIERYVKATNKNIDELTFSVAKTAKDLDGYIRNV